MRRYRPRELRLFLEAIDRLLSVPHDLTIIGGAAAALAYGVKQATRDIDTIGDTAGMQEACERARRETGLEIPVQSVGIFDAPTSFEDRMERLER